MLDPKALDQHFQAILNDLPGSVPDGIININDQMIKSFGLEHRRLEKDASQSYFYVIEAFDKITLIDERFVIWLYPVTQQTMRKETLTFIARHDKPHLPLELVFSTKGPHNHPALVLELLECFLKEIQETEAFVDHLSDECI